MLPAVTLALPRERGAAAPNARKSARGAAHRLRTQCTRTRPRPEARAVAPCAATGLAAGRKLFGSREWRSSSPARSWWRRCSALPGSGRYLVQGAIDRDYPLVMGMIVVYAVLTLPDEFLWSTCCTAGSTRACGMAEVAVPAAARPLWGDAAAAPRRAPRRALGRSALLALIAVLAPPRAVAEPVAVRQPRLVNTWRSPRAPAPHTGSARIGSGAIFSCVRSSGLRLSLLISALASPREPCRSA